jgi:hypothetical protein
MAEPEILRCLFYSKAIALFRVEFDFFGTGQAMFVANSDNRYQTNKLRYAELMKYQKICLMII